MVDPVEAATDVIREDLAGVTGYRRLNQGSIE